MDSLIAIGGVLAIILIDAALVILVPRQRQEKLFLLGAAAYNIIGGLAALLLVISIIVGIYNPSPDLPSSNIELIFQLQLLSSLFFSWVAIIFGIGYLQSARGKAPSRTFLMYGGAVKYWIFIIGIISFFRLPNLSIEWLFGLRWPEFIFVGGGLINLLFAILFTILLMRKADNADAN